MAGWKRWHERKKMEKEGFDRTKFFTRPDLKGRGWTDALIRRYLPAEDATLPNPKVVNAGKPMKLYKRDRVEKFEASEEFQDANRVSERRKLSAKKAVATKLARMQDYVNNLTIEVLRKERKELIDAARKNYYSQCSRGSVTLSEETMCVNYLRHCGTQYESELKQIAGKTGGPDAYFDIKEKVLDEIALTYDWLAEECDRQRDEMNRKRFKRK